MTILDAFLQFTGNSTVNSGTVVVSNGGDSPTGGATLTGSNIIDLHIAAPGIPVLANNQGARDIGIGDNPALKLLVEVTTAFSAGTSLQVQLTGATDNGSGAPAAFSVWWSSPVYAQATLVLGARLMDMDMPRPPDGVAIPRFLQLQYVSVGALNGTLKGWIVIDRHDQFYTGTQNAILSGYTPGVVVAN